MEKQTEPPFQSEVEVYDNFVLTIYDYFVLSFCCPLIWRCSKQKILKLYNQHITNNHLDIGVGTGYFLDKCHFSTQKPSIALLDLSENCLQRTAERIKRYQPDIYQADIYQDIALDERKFLSVGMNYLLHCLPGTIYQKAVIFKNINKHLHPDATVFGATVLGRDIKMSLVARRLMKLYNAKGIFCNADDDLVGLNDVLNAHYKEVTISLSGCVALFVARKPI